MSKKKHPTKQANKLAAPTVSKVVAAHDCTGCSACVALCAKAHAISMRPNAEGFLEPVIDFKKCNHCGKYYRYCHVVQCKAYQAHLIPHQLASTDPNAPQHHNEAHPGFTQRYFALSLKPDFKQLYGAATTGVGFVLAHRFVRSGGVVVGCRLNSSTNEAEHVIARTPEEVLPFCGSKYVQSNKHAVMAEVKSLLQAGTPVLFLGTPCEIAGVTTLCSTLKPEAKDHLFTVDLICHGVPSPLSLKLYAQDAAKELGSITGINFRVFLLQSPDWRNMFIGLKGTKQQIVQHCRQNHYYTAFLENWSLRPSCYHCPYTNLNRPNDLTIGDFWNIERLLPQFPYALLGTSQVLVNSQHGVTLFNLLHNHIRHVQEVPAQMVLQSNYLLHDPMALPPERALFFAALKEQQSTVAAVNTVLAHIKTQHQTSS